ATGFRPRVGRASEVLRIRSRVDGPGESVERFSLAPQGRVRLSGLAVQLEGGPVVKVAGVTPQVLGQEIAAQATNSLGMPERSVQFGVAVEGAVGNVRGADRGPFVVDQTDLGVHEYVLIRPVIAKCCDPDQCEVAMAGDPRERGEKVRSVAIAAGGRGCARDEGHHFYPPGPPPGPRLAELRGGPRPGFPVGRCPGPFHGP